MIIYFIVCIPKRIILLEITRHFYHREQLARYGADQASEDVSSSGCNSWGSDFTPSVYDETPDAKKSCSDEERIYEKVAGDESSVANENYSMKDDMKEEKAVEAEKGKEAENGLGKSEVEETEL